MRHIIEKAEEVLEEFGGRNIFETAENSGANVWRRTLGGLKGFYICENGCRYIVINDELDRVTAAVVCAHELGHDMLHRELSVGGIRENTLFLSSDKTEREANLFAACVLISDETLLEEMSYCSGIDALAANLGFPREIVMYKLETMNYKGYKFNIGDIRNNFLK